MEITDRLRRAGSASVLGAGVGAVVWVAAGYVWSGSADYAGAVAFAVSFGIVMFVLQFLRGSS